MIFDWPFGRKPILILCDFCDEQVWQTGKPRIVKVYAFPNYKSLATDMRACEKCYRDKTKKATQPTAKKED